VAASCANCGAVVSGRYCSSCGQRVDTEAHSVGHFLGEAAEVLTHADSRVWGTLRPLLTRPGFLTREYFAGRRARYLQPFRLYLILSLLFFLLTALLSGGSDYTPDKVHADPRQNCAEVKASVPGSHWLLPRIRAACESITADNGREFGAHIAHNLGRALFVFLPLMAVLMKLLYWRPRRYYLEHLLLLIHNHAFMFLLLSAFMLMTHWVGSSGLRTLLSLVMVWYVVRYLYRSMRVAYGQSGFMTLMKFSVLGAAYMICGLFMLLATVFVSAMML
jgi:Protein of unknown function (DUF3667)